MDDLWTQAIAYVLANEGGYVNDPDDTPTNRGITLATLSAWRKRPCTVDDVRALGLAETQQIYRSLYWNTIAGDQLPATVGLIMFDVAVNCGVGQAAKSAQTIAGVKVDGAIGPISLKAIAAVKLDDFVDQFVSTQHRYYLALVRKKPAKRKFHKTWQKRAAYYYDLLA